MSKGDLSKALYQGLKLPNIPEDLAVTGALD